MSTSNTILKNTVFLYFRMLLTMGVSLYTSRVILDILGVQDYGIYSVVGGLVLSFGFFNAAMSAATERFLAIDIGAKDWDKLTKTFNSALLIHIGIGVTMLIAAETIGLWFVNNKLFVPEARHYEANFVYQFTVFTSITGVILIPFNALLIARERMNLYAVLSILEAVLKLLIAYLLYISTFDKLNTYSVLLFLVAIVVSSSYVIYCKRNFEETRFIISKDKELYKKMLSYSGWNLFGNFAVVAKGQGINMLLNIFFGVIMNAAYGITLQVQAASMTFVNSFQNAVNPQIYKNFASGDMLQMHKLMFQSAKFSFFLAFLLVCPIVYNIDYILILWLKTPPAYTGPFIVLTLGNLILESIARPLVVGAMATGEIKWYQITIGTTLCLNFPISYIAFKLSQDPLSFLYIAIVISIIAIVMRLFFLRRMISLRIDRFIKSAVIPICIVFFASAFFLFFLRSTSGVATSIGGLMAQSLSIGIIMVIIILILGLSGSERNILFNIVKSKMKLLL